MTVTENSVTSTSASWGTAVHFDEPNGDVLYQLPAPPAGYGKVFKVFIDSYGPAPANEARIDLYRGPYAGGNCGGANRVQCSSANPNCTLYQASCNFATDTGPFYALVTDRGGDGYNITFSYADPTSLPANSATNGSVVTSNYFTLPSVTSGNINQITLTSASALSARLYGSTTARCAPTTNLCTIGGGPFAGSCTANVVCGASGTGLEIFNRGGGAAAVSYTLNVTTVSMGSLDAGTVLNVSDSGDVWLRLNIGGPESIIITSNQTVFTTLTLYRDCTQVTVAACNPNSQCSLFALSSNQVGSATNYYVRVSPLVAGTPFISQVLLTVGVANCAQLNTFSTALSFCQGHLADGSYSIPAAGIANTDAQAYSDFLGFYALYQGSCNNSIAAYACSSNFNPCNANTGLFTPICRDKCTSAFSGCPTNVCTTAVCNQQNGPCPAPVATPTKSTTASTVIASFALVLLMATVALA